MQQHAAAQQQVERLQREKTEQAAKIRTLGEQVKQQKEEIARLQLGAAMGVGKADKSAARAQVNRLLREVDKCIALISSEAV